MGHQARISGRDLLYLFKMNQKRFFNFKKIMTRLFPPKKELDMFSERVISCLKQMKRPIHFMALLFSNLNYANLPQTLHADFSKIAMTSYIYSQKSIPEPDLNLRPKSLILRIGKVFAQHKTAKVVRIPLISNKAFDAIIITPTFDVASQERYGRCKNRFLTPADRLADRLW